jgi:ABC-2 type transport system ATP-binding protein
VDPVLDIQSLTKRYGRITAVNQLNLKIYPGQVWGFLGPNGSGKTSTLSMLTGALPKTSGNVFWFGSSVSGKIGKPCGALIEAPAFYPFLTAKNNLKIAAAIKRCPETEIQRVLDISGLSQRQDSSYSTFSLGMKQRLALASVLMGNPEVIILDEPANGLDPEGIAEIRNIILREASNGKTILFASHILDEVEKICSHVAILRKGNLIAAGKVHELLSAEPSIIMGTTEPEKLFEIIVRSGKSKKINRTDSGLEIIPEKGVDPAELNKIAFDNGVVLNRLEYKQPDLEKQFLTLVKS